MPVAKSKLRDIFLPVLFAFFFPGLRLKGRDREFFPAGVPPNIPLAEVEDEPAFHGPVHQVMGKTR